MKTTVFQEIRFSIYFAFLLSGIFIKWIAPYTYKCDYTDERCFACGLRTAVDLFLEGNFVEAYQSNKLIAVLVITTIIMICDIALFIYRAAKNRK